VRFGRGVKCVDCPRRGLHRSIDPARLLGRREVAVDRLGDPDAPHPELAKAARNRHCSVAARQHETVDRQRDERVQRRGPFLRRPLASSRGKRIALRRAAEDAPPPWEYPANVLDSKGGELGTAEQPLEAEAARRDGDRVARRRVEERANGCVEAGGVSPSGEQANMRRTPGSGHGEHRAHQRSKRPDFSVSRMRKSVVREPSCAMPSKRGCFSAVMLVRMGPNRDSSSVDARSSSGPLSSS